MRTTLAWMLTGLSVVLAGGCSSDPVDRGATDVDREPTDTDDSLDGEVSCDTFVKRLVDCGVLIGTKLRGCEDDKPVLPCVTECAKQANCDDIAVAYCEGRFNGYAGCLATCRLAAAPPEFVCNDGTRIRASWQCDNAPDCPDGEDEDCPDLRFPCNDGRVLPEGLQCDGEADCAGGEDELDCPEGTVFTCDDGTTVSFRKECDGLDDCAGGEDELGCAHLSCE